MLCTPGECQNLAPLYSEARYSNVKLTQCSDSLSLRELSDTREELITHRFDTKSFSTGDSARRAGLLRPEDGGWLQPLGAIMSARRAKAARALNSRCKVGRVGVILGFNRPEWVITDIATIFWAALRQVSTQPAPPAGGLCQSRRSEGHYRRR